MTDALAGLSLEAISKIEAELASGMASLDLGTSQVKLTPDMVTVKRYQKTVHVEEITPRWVTRHPFPEQVHSLCVDSRPGDRLRLAEGHPSFFIILHHSSCVRHNLKLTARLRRWP